jgi:hypothetical protein
MPTRKSHHRPAQPATSEVPCREVPPAPLTPASDKIGETPGNLKARSRAFAKRSGRSVK